MTPAMLPIARGATALVLNLVGAVSCFLFWLVRQVFQILWQVLAQSVGAERRGTGVGVVTDGGVLEALQKPALAAAPVQHAAEEQAVRRRQPESGAEQGAGAVAEVPPGKECGIDPEAEEVPASSDDELLLWRLHLKAPNMAESSSLLQIVEEVRAVHPGLRFCVQAEDEHPCVALFGPAGSVRGACDALATLAPLVPEEQVQERLEGLFALHFTMREAWDMPQDEDDELVDASLEADWVDLGPSAGAEGSEEQQDVGRSPATAAAESRPQARSPRSVLRSRLREVLPDLQDVHAFTDENPFANCSREAVRVDFVGPLRPAVWDAAGRAALACEAKGVYLSKQYDAIFWPPAQLRAPLDDQVACALSHWKGQRASLGTGFGISGTGFTGFEDLAANVSAVLRGERPPGWHRLEWTPHGAGAVPHMTY